MSTNDFEKNTAPSESQNLAKAQVGLLKLIAELAIDTAIRSDHEVTKLPKSIQAREKKSKTMDR
jgi:hypothetical protein